MLCMCFFHCYTKKIMKSKDGMSYDAQIYSFNPNVLVSSGNWSFVPCFWVPVPLWDVTLRLFIGRWGLFQPLGLCWLVTCFVEGDAERTSLCVKSRLPLFSLESGVCTRAAQARLLGIKDQWNTQKTPCSKSICCLQMPEEEAKHQLVHALEHGATS